MNRKSKYDWNEIQQFYDSGKSWAEITTKFGATPDAISKAQKRGVFVSRNNSESQKVRFEKNGGRPQSDETKRKLSEIKKKFLEENPEKVPYLLNHSRVESYPERYWREFLEKNNIEFQQEYRESVYSLDFKIGMVDLEIDGEQHYVDAKIVASDRKRTEYLESLGYRIIRIRWAEFVKLSIDERSKFVHSILK